MKNRTRIVYNCFYPEFDNEYDSPVVKLTMRGAKRLSRSWGLADSWDSGSIAQVIRHPRLNLAAAYWIVPTRPFDPRVVSRKHLQPKPQLIRHQRSYFANNGKLKRPEVLRLEGEREARYLADHPEPDSLPRSHKTDDWDDLPF